MVLDLKVSKGSRTRKSKTSYCSASIRAAAVHQPKSSSSLSSSTNSIVKRTTKRCRSIENHLKRLSALFKISWKEKSINIKREKVAPYWKRRKKAMMIRKHLSPQSSPRK